MYIYKWQISIGGRETKSKNFFIEFVEMRTTKIRCGRNLIDTPKV